jgi:hypothetical protein
VSIVREPDDRLVATRVSLGRITGHGFYITFRGDPADAVKLLEDALFVARAALPRGKFTDRRGRPQG